MNEFVEQFLIEARELVQQSTDDLLALETQPDDSDRLDSVFRAFHTLKGAAGIVDFAAMGAAMHAAEDVLASVRAGASQVSTALIGECLSCIDLVVQWLDEMQETGEPPANAGPAADAIAARLMQVHAGGVVVSPAPALAPRQVDDWVGVLTTVYPDEAANALTAIRYSPRPGAFFDGEDPLARMSALPGLTALHVTLADDSPSLEAFDPFECRLILAALSREPAADLSAWSGPASAEIEIRPLGVGGDASGLSAPARALIDAQLQLLAEHAEEGLVGRLASAGGVAANVLRRSGQPSGAEGVERLLAAAVTSKNAVPLIEALHRILAGEPVGGADDAPAEGAHPARAARDVSARVLRVDVERVDALVKLAGELTVAKNALSHAAQLAEREADPKALAILLRNQHAVLERLVMELQQSVLSLRVLPLRQVFQRFPRLVREMAAGLGKPVTLILRGEGVEADKVIVEALFEPLLHVLRNAIDHGVENAEARAAAGKPATAVIQLRAERQGEHVLVEVADDGRGIDVERVRQIAAERGMVSAEALASMSDVDLVDLIFAPGFSTAADVTALSGRGVGMDAVRTAVAQLGGRVQVESRPGAGATVRFTLPFTIIMSRVMTVEAGGQAFGIPLDALVQTSRVPRDHISPMGAGAAFVLHDRTVPLIDLGEALGANAAAARNATATVLVAAVEGQWIGLEVDRVGERMDVMLKPMDGLLAGMPGVAGTTLLGDGRVLIVLDLAELIG